MPDAAFTDEPFDVNVRKVSHTVRISREMAMDYRPDPDDRPPYIPTRPMVTGSTPAATARVARLLRRIADRLDHRGAAKATHLSFTFERGRGLVVNDDGRGCRLWHLSDDDYAKAHTEATHV